MSRAAASLALPLTLRLLVRDICTLLLAVLGIEQVREMDGLSESGAPMTLTLAGKGMGLPSSNPGALRASVSSDAKGLRNPFIPVKRVIESVEQIVPYGTFDGKPYKRMLCQDMPNELESSIGGRERAYCRKPSSPRLGA